MLESDDPSVDLILAFIALSLVGLFAIGAGDLSALRRIPRPAASIRQQVQGRRLASPRYEPRPGRCWGRCYNPGR